MEINEKIENKLLNISKEVAGINIRRINNKGIIVYVAYLPPITDRKIISQDIIKPLMNYEKPVHDNDEIAETVIYVDDVELVCEADKILSYILAGKSIITIAGSTNYIVAETQKIEKRNVTEPQVQYALRAPKDSFTENLDTNISLLRYRIRDEKLKLDEYVVGERTKTKVIVAYLENIVDKNIVEEVEKIISNITIDGILESSYIQKMLNGKGYPLFPTVAISERSDKASATILKGRIVVIVEGSAFALMLPETFMDFLDSGDDHYGTPIFSVFNNILRLLGITVNFCIPAFYLVITSYNPDILPAGYLLSIAAARSAVPLNAIIEVLFITAVNEILREASVRLPTKIGSAIGIVGGIVIGQATVAAGIASPVSIVVVAFATISSFLIPDYTIVNPVSVLKIILILLTGVLGLFGFLMGISFIAVSLISQDSFGVDYAKPIAPLDLGILKNHFNPELRFNIENSKATKEKSNQKDEDKAEQQNSDPQEEEENKEGEEKRDITSKYYRKIRKENLSKYIKDKPPRDK